MSKEEHLSQTYKQLCYWQARSLPDTVILLSLFAVVLAIFGCTLWRLKSVLRYGEQVRNIVKIYLLILAWSMILGYQYLYGTLTYLTIFRGHQDTIDYDAYSRMYVRIDIIPGFIVQTIFLFICRLFFKGLTNSISVSKMKGWEMKVILGLRAYCVLRWLVQGTCIILINILAYQNQIFTLINVSVWVLIADCIITNFFLIVSLRIFKVRFTQVQSLDEAQFNKLKRQYTIMIGISVIRIVIDFVFLLVPLLMAQKQSCLGPFSEHSYRTIVYTGLGNTVNHIVPILWILKIYSVSSYQQSVTQSDNDEQVSSRLDLIQSLLKSQ